MIQPATILTQEEIEASRVAVLANWRKEQKARHIKNEEMMEDWSNRDWYEKYYHGMTGEEVTIMNDMMRSLDEPEKQKPAKVPTFGELLARENQWDEWDPMFAPRTAVYWRKAKRRIWRKHRIMKRFHEIRAINYASYENRLLAELHQIRNEKTYDRYYVQVYGLVTREEIDEARMDLAIKVSGMRGYVKFGQLYWYQHPLKEKVQHRFPNNNERRDAIAEGLADHFGVQPSEKDYFDLYWY